MKHYSNTEKTDNRNFIRNFFSEQLESISAEWHRRFGKNESIAMRGWLDCNKVMMEAFRHFGIID